MTTTKSQTKTKKAPPVAKYNIGRVQASIWKRDTDNGTFFDVSFKRGFKTKDGWKNSYSFDLPGLVALQHLVGTAIEDVLKRQETAAPEADLAGADTYGVDDEEFEVEDDIEV